jgi:hypothetical protein
VVPELGEASSTRSPFGIEEVGVGHIRYP